MRVSSTTGKSERIKTHQCSFYTPKITCNATVGLHGQSLDPQNEAIRTKFRHLIFQAPPDSPLGSRAPPQSIMRCPRRPIGPYPSRSTLLFKWIHSPESESSTPSEEALVRGTSHVQCNPLTLPNTRS
ncbi:hypothetical protein M9H77_35508 [Catharanthus roseus]|uniref:Uncharacterized protein n=1 Tax=Catharanthus roseus TaxID=4058 RepID=A0ACB9ZPI5_CATRO|nr:hypothetical protein M9H77_35508 [Catharanthus roseus]